MPQLVIKLGDNVVQNYSFDKAILNIGRSRDNDVVIDNLAVSRNHCRIRMIDDKYILTDLNSANGTFVNGVRITKTEVMAEDIISVGKHKLIFQLDDLQQEEEIGDAFAADRTVIAEHTPDGILTVTKGKNRGHKYKVTKYETTIGRAAENDIVLNDWFVSKVHAKIIKQGSTYILKDLGSWKGSFVNEKQVKDPTVLRENDELRFGSSKLHFCIYDEQKVLQVEGRRPEELAYDENAAQMPQFVPTNAAAPPPRSAPSDPSYLAMDAIDDSEPPRPRSRAGYGMKSGGSVEDFAFDELPEAEPAQRPTPPPPEAAPRQAVHDTGKMAAVASPHARPAPPPAPSSAPSAPPRGVVWRDFESAPAPRNGGREPAPAAIVTPAPAHTPSSNMTPVEHAERAAAEVSDVLRDQAKLVEVWEKALNNKSPLIRKQAAKMLKKLTGKDYEIPQ